MDEAGKDGCVRCACEQLRVCILGRVKIIMLLLSAQITLFSLVS
jgi:hypothetical protein